MTTPSPHLQGLLPAQLLLTLIVILTFIRCTVELNQRRLLLFYDRHLHLFYFVKFFCFIWICTQLTISWWHCTHYTMLITDTVFINRFSLWEFCGTPAKARYTLPINTALIYAPYLRPVYTGTFLTPIHMGRMYG